MKKIDDVTQEEIEEKKMKEPLTFKGVLLRSIFSSVFAILLFVAVLLIELNGLKLSWDAYKFRILCDSFFIAGVFPVLFWLLLWVAAKGAFDMIAYSMGKMLSFMFRIHPEKSNLPPTYADYVEQKRAKAKPFHYELLIVGGVFLLLGVIFLILNMCFEG